MLEKVQTLEKLMESISRGLIYVDAEGRIQAFSKKAKEITGIIFERTYSHEAGKICEGDIVIIADNELGNDDGGMSPDDLKLLNLKENELKAGDAVICVGVYKNKKIDPVFKYMRGYRPNGLFTLETSYLGFNIAAAIDFGKYKISITVNGDEYAMDYFEAIGHIVVIDGNSGNIKFFQAKGYGVRGEEAGHLLRGKHYLEKKDREMDESLVPTIGVKLLDIIKESDFTDKVFALLNGEGKNVYEGIFEINKRVTSSTFVRIDDEEGKTKGVYIMIQDGTQLSHIIEERNAVISQIEQRQKGRKAYISNSFPKDAFKTFIGSDPAMNEVKQLAYKASKTKFNVIITGESGTGKSLLAREIHNLQNKKAPFVEVNCNAIAPTLFESELFGYVGGAFTGAASGGKSGYFEEADGGTIFLDEIGEIPLEIQIKLLHVLQNKVIYRVGSSRPINVDVRVIAATNRDLEEEVLQGNFRRDLFYRINVFPIDIPPLRKRKEDLYILINSVLNKICKRYDVEFKQFSGEALEKMMSYNWPGNVRELENIIERAIILCDSPLIYAEHIKVGYEAGKKTLKELLSEEESRIIKDTLNKYNGDKKKTMEELGISKSVMYEKLKTT